MKKNYEFLIAEKTLQTLVRLKHMNKKIMMLSNNNRFFLKVFCCV